MLLTNFLSIHSVFAFIFNYMFYFILAHKILFLTHFNNNLYYIVYFIYLIVKLFKMLLSHFFMQKFLYLNFVLFFIFILCVFCLNLCVITVKIMHNNVLIIYNNNNDYC